MLYGVGVGNSCEALTAIAKGSTGNDSTLVLVKKSFTELLTGETEFSNIGENVECALGLEALDTYLAKAIENEFSSSVFPPNTKVAKELSSNIIV